MTYQAKCSLRGRFAAALSILVIAALVLLPMSIVPTHAAELRAQPILLALAAEQPDATLSVIVQKTGPAGMEQLVASLGGTVTRDLSIINSFAADMPAHALPALAAANGVRWVSLDAPLQKASCDQCIDTSDLENTYVQTIGADRLWNTAPYLQGQGVGVAVVDSGIDESADLSQTVGRRQTSRITASVKIMRGTTIEDDYGHGTHIAGIIGGNGAGSDGERIGVAPRVNLINVKVSDNKGVGSISNVIEGLQWVNNHRHDYNIQVVNLSLHSSEVESYRTSPLDAAVEVLWFNRIVVVVAAGNSAKNGVLYPPANDPFVITVGATDDKGTASTADDVVVSFSSYGRTESGFNKPDLVAPGTNIVSLLADRNAVLPKAHPDHIVNGDSRSDADYFRMSGTSMSSAVTAGAAALLLQSNPRLTPDQVKSRLMTTGAASGGQWRGDPVRST